MGRRSHSVSSCIFGTESNSCCHPSTMECFSLSRRHMGEDMAAVTPNSLFQVLSFPSAHSRKVMISLLAPQSGAAPWTRSLCPPSGLCPACLAPLRAPSEAGAGSRAGEIPQNKANSFPFSLQLVAGTVTLARCYVALVGSQLQWAPSATDTAPCFSSTQEPACRPGQSALSPVLLLSPGMPLLYLEALRAWKLGLMWTQTWRSPTQASCLTST